MPIKNTPSVIHFLGKENPIALRKAEVNKMLGKMDEMAEAGGMSMSEPFIIGETIKIIEGPFNDFNGIIEEVNDEKKKLKVTVKIFRKIHTCGIKLYAGRKDRLKFILPLIKKTRIIASFLLFGYLYRYPQTAKPILERTAT